MKIRRIKMERVAPKKIGIRFPDNDFGTIVSLFLRILGENTLYYQEGETPEEIKERIEKIFKMSIGGLYVAAQNQLTYGGIDDTIAYLERRPVYVHIDEEVDSCIDKCGGWDNGEFFVIDFTNPHQENGYVYSI
jgi:hypothetical protein